MPVKMKGVDFQAFMAADWGSKDAYWEGEEVTVDDQTFDTADGDPSTIAPDATVVVTGGVIFMDGDDREGVETERFVRKWLKARDTISVVLELPKDLDLASLKALVKGAFPKVRFI